MARKPRIHFFGAFYHVILRGNDKNKIFFSNTDREYFYFLINEGVKRYKHRIHAFCLMTNHIHLAVEVAAVPLSKIIQNLSFRYTRYINQTQGKIGHLFQGRFKAILVEEDQYLLDLIRYIHLNPVRAKMVANAEDYLWSSHRVYLGLENISWLTSKYIFDYFDNTHQGALYRYIEFMLCIPDESLQNKFQIGNHRNYAILGGDDFLLKIKGFSTVPLKPYLNLDQLVKIICIRYSVEAEQLKNTSHTHHYTKVRAIIAWLAREFNICTFKDVATYFKRDSTGLIRVIRRLEGSYWNELALCKELIEKSVCQA